MSTANENKGSTQNRNEKQKDIRATNIQAAKTLADVIRTSLGPRGMDKMIKDGKNQTLITNDGATILKKMEVIHPIAKMLVEISKAQDIEVGDGTTSVVIIAGSLLKGCETLLDKGIHPTTISEGYQEALDICLGYLNEYGTDVDMKNKETLISCVNTCLSSKVVSQSSHILSPIAVDAVLKVCNPNSTNIDLRDIRVVKKLGGTIDDCKMVEGIVLTENKPAHSAGGPTRVTDAKIALLQFCLSAPKTDMENTVVVNEYNAMDRILKEERQYIMNMVKKIVKSGANVLLIQKSILRDATNELSLHFLAKKNIMVVKDIERTEVEFISKTIQCIPVAHIDNLTPEKLGKADLVTEEKLEDDSTVLKITGVPMQNLTQSILVRGSNRLILDEAERSLHDALCVIRSLVKKKQVITGGGSVEIELSQKLSTHSKQLSGQNQMVVKAFAEALEIIPFTLAENAGLNAIQIVTQLRNLHKNNNPRSGISIKKNHISQDLTEENVLQPALVTQSALQLATECVRMILKIDDLVFSAR